MHPSSATPDRRRDELRHDLRRLAEGGIVEHGEILAHGTIGGLGQQALAARHAALAVGIGLDHAGIDREAVADHLRQAIADKGALAVIPNNPSRTKKHPLDKHLYAQRHLIKVLLQQIQAVSPGRHTLRENRSELPRRCPPRGYYPMAVVSVHTS